MDSKREWLEARFAKVEAAMSPFNSLLESRKKQDYEIIGLTEDLVEPRPEESAPEKILCRCAPSVALRPGYMVATSDKLIIFHKATVGGEQCIVWQLDKDAPKDFPENSDMKYRETIIHQHSPYSVGHGLKCDDHACELCTSDIPGHKITQIILRPVSEIMAVEGYTNPFEALDSNSWLCVGYY